MTTLTDLRKLALAATPGPWKCEYHNADGDYIAALSPERVLAMIAVIEAAKAMRDAYVKAWRTDDPLPKSVAAFDAERAKLEKEQK